MRNSTVHFAVYIVLLLAVALYACGFPRGQQQTAGTGAPDRPEFADLLEEKASAAFDTLGVGGVQYGIVEGVSRSYIGGYGYSNSSEGCPMDGDRPLNVASLSKPVTAILTLILHEKGIIDLDSSVFSYATVPESRFAPYAGAITFRRILKHRAGLGMPSVPFFSAADSVKSAYDVVMGDYRDGNPLQVLYRPDSVWSYSGGGYTLLQQAVEEATGKGLDALAREYVFEPLQMTHSAFNPTWSRQSCNPQYYDSGGKPQQPYYTVGGAAGGLTTSSGDFTRFMQELIRMRRGESALLSKEAFRAIEGDIGNVDLSIFGLQLEERVENTIGFFVHRDLEDVALYHSGGNPGVVAYFILSLDQEKGVFLCVNHEGGRPLLQELVLLWCEHNDLGTPPFF